MSPLLADRARQLVRDTFYSNSQVYCHFDGPDGTPYDDLFYVTQEQNPGGPIFYMKVAGATEVRKNSKKAGTL